MRGEDLRKHAVSGMRWAMLGRLLKTLVSVGTIALLSHYLLSAEFGVFMIVSLVTNFAQIFVDAGLRVALVQRKEVTRLQENTVFWTNMAFSVALAGTIFVFADQIARAFDAEAVGYYLKWMAIVFPMTGLQSVPMSVLERRFAFRPIALSDLAVALSGSALVVVLVLSGLKIEALVAQQLFQGLVSTTIICALARWRPGFEFSIAEFRSLMSYAGYVTMTNTVNFLNTNLDRIVVGGVISPTALGYLSMAQTMVGSPFRMIVIVARKTLFPILSSVQDDQQRMRSAYLSIQFSMMAIMAPICLGLAAVAHPAVAILFAPEWAPVAPLVQLVALFMLLASIQEINQVTLTSLGYARFQFWWVLAMSGVSLAALWLAAPFGVEAALLARIGISACATPALSFFTMRRLGMAPSALLRTLFGVLLAAVVMFGVVAFSTSRIPASEFVILLVTIPLGVVIYGPLLFLLAPERSSDLLKAALNRNR